MKRLLGMFLCLCLLGLIVYCDNDFLGPGRHYEYYYGDVNCPANLWVTRVAPEWQTLLVRAEIDSLRWNYRTDGAATYPLLVSRIDSSLVLTLQEDADALTLRGITTVDEETLRYHGDVFEEGEDIGGFYGVLFRP